jgi:hypothetical protein
VAAIAQSVLRLARFGRKKNRVLYSVEARYICSTPIPICILRPLRIQVTGSRDMMLIIRLLLVLGLRVSGALPLFFHTPHTLIISYAQKKVQISYFDIYRRAA